MRAVGIIRVSEVGDRDRENLGTVEDQRERIERACTEQRWDLQSVGVELNVSGGAPLAERAHLREAVQAIERGKAQVLVVAFFDRAVRSLEVQGQVIARVEMAGGQVFSADGGKVSHKTATGWMMSTTQGMMAEYQRRSTGERTVGGKVKSVRDGTHQGHDPIGLSKDARKVLQPNGDTKAVADAFLIATRDKHPHKLAVKAHLEKHFPGMRWTVGCVRRVLSNRVYIGEIKVPRFLREHFDGREWIEGSHKGIVEPGVFWSVQVEPRETKQRLPDTYPLTGFAKCGTCGGSMHGRRDGVKRVYRCSQAKHRDKAGTCSRPAAMNANNLESYVMVQIFKAAQDAGGFGRWINGSQEIDTQTIETALDKVTASIHAWAEERDLQVAQLDNNVDEYRRLAQKKLTQRNSLQAELVKAQAGAIPTVELDGILSRVRDGFIPWAQVQGSTPDDPQIVETVTRGSLESLTINPGKGKPGPDRVQMVTRKGNTL